MTTMEDKGAPMIKKYKCFGPEGYGFIHIENDDKESQYTTEDLHVGVYSRIGIPITFDYHHHWCHPGELTQEELVLCELAQNKESLMFQLTQKEPFQ